MSTSSSFNSNQNQQIFMRHADVISADSKPISRSYITPEQTYPDFALHQTSLYVMQLTASTAGLPRKHICSPGLHVRIAVHVGFQLLLLSSTTDHTSHFCMILVLFPPKRSNEQDSLPHITPDQTSQDFALHQTSLYATQLTTSTAGLPLNHKEVTLLFVYGSSDINILHLPFFRSGKDPLDDLIYTSCTDPIQQPAVARTPRLYTSPRLCQSLVLRLCEKCYKHRV
ncbi:hypothetical protein F511_39707 [Dorcoceras hygrometricum]|uniref:Uncharacterized protein n=1 Tax=Dorcoceras hygrometricum TaxID=472368 RepID=A0A2Z7DEV0_9LAMI|nr:hypothetical protein F511_39707 [Dorcoceras hygrometricum]